MKYTLPLAFASLASANIIFNHVDLWCDLESAQLNHGCLRGQVCTEDHKCVTPNEEVSYNEHIEVRAVYSTDGTCGAQNGGTLCDPNATAYSGICCSQYGWCGSTDAYCGDGCQSNCTTAATSSVPASSSTSAAAGTATSATSTAPRDDGRCGVDFGGATCEAGGPYGGCCSSYGYCGTTDAHCLASEGCQSGCSGTSSSSSGSAAAPSSSSAADSSGTVTATPTQSSGEPVIQPTTATSPTSTANAEVTTDGTCGAAYNHTVCGDWPQGSCCSMYGYCGDTSAHCGEGCQSGNCTTTPSAEAPGASPAPAAATQGSFNITGRSGVPAMHMALMPNGRVMFLDKIENYTELTLSSGYYAYSSEYNPEDNTVVPLAYKTNAFCSGGSFLADGRVVSLGGNANLEWLDPTVTDGWDAVRYLERSSTDTSLDGQDWSEPGNKLASNRWYATVQTMGDGTLFVASGSLNGLDPTVPANNNPTYEILSADAVSSGVNVPFEILEKNQPYYMYPFIHLLRDGTLFVFASKSSEQFNVGTNTTVQSYPDLAGDYRTYPNTGGSVLLPLSSANNYDPDVIICGGGAYQDITSPTDPSCGRIQPLSTNPTWEMDSMPEGRGMVEGTLLPDGTIVWLNGGNEGAQGFGLMQSPTLEALLYNGSAPLGSRFKTLASSTIPRLYHSVATLLLDGTLMVAGSNPVEMPVLQASAANPFVTEFRVEIYTPPYLQGDKANKRPTNVALSSKSLTANGQTFTVTFTAPSGAQKVQAVLYHGGFVTHSVHMGHRMINLDSTGWAAGSTSQTLTVTMPPNTNVAPPGPYVVYIMVDGVPSIGQFVMVA